MNESKEVVGRAPFEEFYPAIREQGAVPEALETFWDEFAAIPKDRCGNIQKEFLWWPTGTNDNDICRWFDQKYPGGILELMKKRMNKKFGEGEWERRHEFYKKYENNNLGFFLMHPPSKEEQAATRDILDRYPELLNLFKKEGVDSNETQ